MACGQPVPLYAVARSRPSGAGPSKYDNNQYLREFMTTPSPYYHHQSLQCFSVVLLCSLPALPPLPCGCHICAATQPIAKRILNLCNMVKANLDRSNGVSVVHCSDSIGRSGVFIALMKLTTEIESSPDDIDICQTVFDMRACRMKMVRGNK